MSIEYTAVGISVDDTRVVVVMKGSMGYTTIEMGEQAARKLADDVLRNANFLWPIEEKSGD
jgi:hypothetical protein